MSQSLTDVGVAASGDQEVVVVCDACTSGSPLLKSYVQLMNNLLKVMESTPSRNPWIVPWQANNIITKKTQSDIWAQRSNIASLSIADQSNGVKSDMIALNKINDRMIAVWIGLINTKFVRKETIPASTITAIKQLLDAQVGNAGLFANKGTINPLISYEDLMQQLISLHRNIAELTNKDPITSYVLLWYRSNPLLVTKIINFYECAHIVPTCRSQTTTINDTASSVKKYRAQIIRAGEQIKFALSKEYRDTSEYNSNSNVFTKEWRKNLMSKIKVRVNGRSVSDQYSQIIGKSRDFTSEVFKENSRKMQQAQADEKDQIIATQQAIAQGIQLSVPTSSRRIVVANQPSYNQQATDVMIAWLNAQSDRIITKLLNDQQAALKADSRPYTYDIPKLANEIYLAWLKVNDAANMAKNKCDEHCSNIDNWSCGVSVAS